MRRQKRWNEQAPQQFSSADVAFFDLPESLSYSCIGAHRSISGPSLCVSSNSASIDKGRASKRQIPMSQSHGMNDAASGQTLDLGSLLGRCMGNFQMVERILSTFRVTGQADFEQLQGAIESADFSAVAEVSHRFRGAASNVSATGLHELLKQAEQLAHERNHEELLMILGRLGPEWEKFERYSQTIAPTGGNPSCVPVRQLKASLEPCHAGADC
jgi:HPt (histidine-containing phosphotransfer) domain-containing protein